MASKFAGLDEQTIPMLDLMLLSIRSDTRGVALRPMPTPRFVRCVCSGGARILGEYRRRLTSHLSPERPIVVNETPPIITTIQHAAMSGIGRRTQYRKHLTDSVLFDSPEPQSNERIAKVVATRGSNQFDVRLARTNFDTPPDTDTSNGGAGEGDSDGSDTVLAILPTKFRTLVWVKRNDFVIVRFADDRNEMDYNDRNDSGGIRYMISHVLYKDQIHHLLDKNLWPIQDPEFASWSPKSKPSLTVLHGKDANDDGIVYAPDNYSSDENGITNNDELLFVNTNRVANLELHDTSSDDGDGDDNDD
jgi:probable RNA-binding protein EIF1AD